MPGPELHQILLTAEARVTIYDDRLEVKIALGKLLHLAVGPEHIGTYADLLDSGQVVRTMPMEMKRRGQELKLIFAASGAANGVAVHPKLVELIAKALRARVMLLNQPGEICPLERPHLTRLARLSYLAPDIINAILDGRQPLDLTPRALLRTARLPTSWSDQRRLLGFR
jgi:hypothetical protein